MALACIHHIPYSIWLYFGWSHSNEWCRALATACSSLYTGTYTFEKFFQYDVDKLLSKLEQIIQLLDKHAELEYETYQWNDTPISTTLGQRYSVMATKSDNQRHASLDAYPIPKEIVQWMKTALFSNEDLAYFNFYHNLSEYPLCS